MISKYKQIIVNKRNSQIIKLYKSGLSAQEAINELKGLLSWSDRIGSDERYTIQGIIKLLTNK